MAGLYVLDWVLNSDEKNVQATHPSPPPPPVYVFSEFEKNMQIMAEHGNEGFCKGNN